MTKESFNPEHINDFFVEHEDITIIPVGSYYWFKDIEGFEPHDYDYIRLIKADTYGINKIHYMFMDVWDICYDSSKGKEGYIEFILNYVKETEKLNYYLDILLKPICDFFNIIYEDIEPYIDTIISELDERLKSDKLIKYRYNLKIIEYIKEKRGFNLTKKQLKEVYKIYVENKKEQNKRVMKINS